jgi:regulator of sirC expression with transglutaminase-like and TPR domain
VTFAELAADPDARLDLLALAIAGEFGEVDAAGSLATLDVLGEELAELVAVTDRTPRTEAEAVVRLLGVEHGFAGDGDQYDRPDNSMLDAVLARRRGLPILLSVVYVEVARRAGVDLRGVGLPGHFVVGHFGQLPPLLLDPFDGGTELPFDDTTPAAVLKPWTPHEIALRMLNNLVPAFERRGDLAAALHAAQLRLELPATGALRDDLKAGLLAVQARLN